MGREKEREGKRMRGEERVREKWGEGEGREIRECGRARGNMERGRHRERGR